MKIGIHQILMKSQYKKTYVSDTLRFVFLDDTYIYL